MTEGVWANPGEMIHESTALRRRRFRWLRRFLYGVAAMIVGVLVLRLVWGFLAQRELDNLIASYRAEGGPVTVDEFNAELDSVPANENAAVLYEKAATTYVAVSQSGVSFESFSKDEKRFAEQPDVAAELMEANAETLTLLREARSRPQVAWSARLGVPESQLDFMNLRMVIRLMWFATEFSQYKGDYRAAIEALRDLTRFCEAAESHPDSITTLLAYPGRSHAFEFVEQFGSGLQVDTCQIDDCSTPASRDQIQALIERWLDYETHRENIYRSMSGERANSLHNAASTVYSEWNSLTGCELGCTLPWDSIPDFLLQPAVTYDAMRQARFDTTARDIVLAEPWPGFGFADKESESHYLYHLALPLTRNQMWGEGFSLRKSHIRVHHTSLAQRRMAALALSIRLFEIDHGARPASLQQLVPDYVTALPIDPYSMNGQSFLYRPDASPPFLYSVGGDGIDQAGQEVLTPDGRIDRYRSDIKFMLAPEEPQ